MGSSTTGSASGARRLPQGLPLPSNIEGLSLEADAAGAGNFSVLLDLVRAPFDGLVPGVLSSLLSASNVSSGMCEQGADMGCGQLSLLPACMAEAVSGCSQACLDAWMLGCFEVCQDCKALGMHSSMDIYIYKYIYIYIYTRHIDSYV